MSALTKENWCWLSKITRDRPITHQIVGGCSPILTHIPRTRVNCGRFIFKAEIFVPTGVSPEISVLSLLQAIWICPKLEMRVKQSDFLLTN
ncbi:MAG: hypothetical protein PUP93_17260 [Rhizonema sp. NSF051]|nr:hypothetical protein [Rhizonema sp. NSF051]